MNLARRTFAACGVATLCAVGAPLASAQLPEGIDPAEVQSMIPSEVTVRAGETTTVDLGVPVDANYSGGGWTVTSNGTQVSVTAPDDPGATASVPASSGGMNATVNLVAVGDDEEAIADDASSAGGAASAGDDASGSEGGSGARESGRSGEDGDGESAGDAGDTEDSGDSGDSGDSAGSAGSGHSRNGGGSGKSGGAAGSVSHPDRTKAEEVDTSGAKRFEFDGEIDGNTLVVKVPLSRAADLMKYTKTDTEGATLRYLDVNGQVIKGVKRDVDVAKRTLTLTYPEGETPDNPFIMEVVRDGKAEFVAVITATNAPTEEASGDGESPYGEASASDQGPNTDSNGGGSIVPLIIGGVALLAAIALIIVFFVRRRARA
ncbi:hypothetical protein [Corynebacterium sp. NML 150383]|uniref:hypothetical protein n=1 Tax=Corynebacterium sp. NML 150383 TaxID=2029400 RepID=UPI001177EF4E|nr:hypothetical protein [Corynebacterium sp. NML 150383]